jgi:hypothetical protein
MTNATWKVRFVIYYQGQAKEGRQRRKERAGLDDTCTTNDQEPPTDYANISNG